MVGIDDLRHSAGAIPSLTSVAVDPLELGRISARILLAELGLSGAEPGTPPEPRLVARESCGCRAGSAPG